jgi:alpha-galactosidase
MTLRRLAYCSALVAASVAIGTAAMPGLQEQAALQGADPPAGAIWVDSLDLSRAPIRRPRGGGPGRGAQPAATPAPPPPPLTYRVGGVTYPHGVGINVNADVAIDLKGAATKFIAMVGLDETPAPGRGGTPTPPPATGSVTFDVWVDGKHLGDSGVMKRGDAPKLMSVDLRGANRLFLAVHDAGDGPQGDTASWAGAMLMLAEGAQSRPEVMTLPAEAAPPIPSSRTAEPRLNHPRITGATPGRPFLFRIPASGVAPLTFEAKNLPAGLTLNATSGIITGSLGRDGRTIVTITASNSVGKATADFTIVGGRDALALTPPLGWNSWNVWGGNVTADHVRAAADGMVASGLAAQGYTYINIDDAWEAGWRTGENRQNEPAKGRDANGEMLTNEKFPDMKGLVDYIHSKGLKAGIYTGPGTATCQGLAASFGHEEQDARTFAKWGFDYLKYDWCRYPEQANTNSPRELLQKPYILMRGILDKLDRDVVFSLCQYGWGHVWEWGDQVGGNLWRVTGDITDTWPSMSGIGFQQTGHEKYAGPGHWNDTDMLVVGNLGWGRFDPPRPTQLTPNEQITHLSLWSLQAAPLLIGADMAHLDDFTINLLGNPEVLSVNQDVLGKAAGRLIGDGRTDIWARPLSDGTMAVGLFNRMSEPASLTVKFADIGLSGSQPVRDLWMHRDLPRGTNEFNATVPRHGAVLVKIGTAKR